MDRSFYRLRTGFTRGRVQQLALELARRCRTPWSIRKFLLSRYRFRGTSLLFRIIKEAGGSPNYFDPNLLDKAWDMAPQKLMRALRMHVRTFVKMDRSPAELWADIHASYSKKSILTAHKVVAKKQAEQDKRDAFIAAALRASPVRGIVRKRYVDLGPRGLVRFKQLDIHGDFLYFRDRLLAPSAEWTREARKLVTDILLPELASLILSY